MVITDASLLGYNVQKQYFEGEIFAKGNIEQVTVTGYVIDYGTSDGVSSSISQEIKRIFEPHSNNVGGSSSLSNYNLAAPLIVNNIVINNYDHGKGKILSVRSIAAPTNTENMIRAGKYEITFEFFTSLYGTNFQIQGASGTDDYELYNDSYSNLESVLSPYASRLTGFSESFDYNRSATGEESYDHSLNILVEDSGVRGQNNAINNIAGTNTPATSTNIATYIAWQIYNNVRPVLPKHWASTFNLKSNSNLFSYTPNDAFYTETINGGNAEGYTDYPSLDGTIGVPGKYELMDQSKIGANLKSSL